MPSVGLTHDVQPSLASGLFAARVASEGRRFVHAESWRTTSDEPDLGEPLLRESGGNHATTLVELGEALVLFAFASGHVSVTVAAREQDIVDAIFRDLRERLPSPDPSSKHEVPVTFWTYGSQGPQQSWRPIAVPEWDEIEANYRTSTQGELAALMRGFRPSSGGQLILWHGQAGTGKTFALRSLAWEWREWCQLNYIVDPDAFFGQHADYLMSVLLEQDGQGGGALMARMRSRWTGYATISRSGVFIESDDDEEDSEPPWRVLVLEDAGELIQADARAAAGQGLSRFLNVVDGLIGQGLRVLVLVTTNEEVRRLHPAVARPGRCAANIEFGPLSTSEANEWLERQGSADRLGSPATLASLFARVEGRDPDQAVSIGFAEA